MAKKKNNSTATAAPAADNAQDVGLTPSELNELRERMKGIVFRMYRFFPFWGLLAENCKVSIKSDKDVPTACVD